MITLATLPNATEQQVFDQVANHLLTQKEKCLQDNNNVACQYHNDHLRCAAGCLISKEEYEINTSIAGTSYFEGNNWDVLVEDYGVPSDHKELITELQTIHDDICPDHWKRHLEETAFSWGLDFNFQDK